MFAYGWQGCKHRETLLLLCCAAGLPCDMSVSGAGAAFKCSVLRMLCDVRALIPLTPLQSACLQPGYTLEST